MSIIYIYCKLPKCGLRYTRENSKSSIPEFHRQNRQNPLPRQTPIATNPRPAAAPPATEPEKHPEPVTRAFAPNIDWILEGLAPASIGATDYAEIGRLGVAVANWRALISKCACEQLP